ncbi:hypothetical protein BVX98_01160 [bacterium F11]|nr:hypothetical protein BVX98_01160 [bacterium F11]
MTCTGSFPKNPELTELKYRVQKGFQQPAELDRKERMATENWLRKQDKWNLDVVVDGEMNRGDFIGYFANRIEGFEPGGLVRCYGNRYYQKPVIKSKLQWKEPLIVNDWRGFQRTTNKPLKAILTGPYTLFDWSYNEFYSDRESGVRDLTEIIKKEIVSLLDVGARIIQIDEPALSSRPAEFSLISDSLKEITAGTRAYFILHHCYGDVVPIWSKMQRLPVDQFSLEATNSQFSILSLLKKVPSPKDLSIGVVESHQHNVETPPDISRRIRKVMKSVPPRQLWFSPDCGLKTRRFDEAERKMHALSLAIKKVRTSLS